MGDSTIDLTSVEQVVQARTAYEGLVEDALVEVLGDFVADVIDDAVEALGAAVLVAAGGRRRDPFAFTNVMERWAEAIRRLEAMREHTRLRPYRVREVLMAWDMPSQMYEQVVALLREADEKGWTALGAKRKLGDLLVPRFSSGKWNDRSQYRVAIRRIARTLATENFNEDMSRRLAVQGFGYKEWVSRHDDAVRDTHREADGQTVPTGETFRVGAARMMFPGDPLAPYPEIVNCRCVIVGAKEGSTMGRNLTAAAVDTTEETPLGLWVGTIGMENTMTGDGRMIESGALRWDDLPVPIRYVAKDVGAHDGAEVVGSIRHIERHEDGRIDAAGTFDLSSEIGREAFRVVGDELVTGVSMDLDDVSFEVRVAEEIVREMGLLDGGAEATAPDGEQAGEARAVVDGKVVMMEMSSDDEVHVTTSARIRAATLVSIPAFAEAKIRLVSEDADEEDESDPIEQLDPEVEGEGVGDTYNWVEDVGGLPEYIRDIADALMRGGMTESRAIATAVNTVKRWARGGSVRADGGPNVSAATAAKAMAALAEWEAKKAAAKAAAADTAAMASDVDSDSDSGQGKVTALVAGGGPEVPPAEWFRDPNLSEPTAVVVTKDGRVYGHLATWDSCHIAHPDFCTSPPRSRQGYAYFHTGSVETTEGEVSVGHLTLNTSHAKAKASPLATLAHYENTGLTAADVRAGEDEFGIWVAGALRPHVSDRDARALKAAPLSGDWRRIQGNLELVAALAVNVPGFPVPRPQGMVASGSMQSLVASGMVPPKKVKAPGTEGALSADDLRYLKSLVAKDKRNRAERMARLLKAEKVAALAGRLSKEEN